LRVGKLGYSQLEDRGLLMGYGWKRSTGAQEGLPNSFLIFLKFMYQLTSSLSQMLSWYYGLG